MKRSRFGRMVQIVAALQSGQNNRVDDLVKMCKLSRRTIFRDLKELKEIGISYHYDAKTGTYSTGPGFFLPPVNLNREEALGLLLLVYKARNCIHLPFKDSVLRAALKIENNLPGEIRQYCNTVLRNISIKAIPQARIDLLDKIFAQLQQAVLKKQVVNIHYYLPREQKSIVTNLSPYHLMHNDHAWYVLGKSSLHKRVHAFALNQIKELNTLDKCFVEDRKFDVNDYLGRAWSMAPEGKLYNVRLRFLPEIANSVAEIQWHSTQTATFENDGSVIIEFRVDGLNEITWWILSHGNQVRVLAPRILRRKIIEIARKMARTNQRESPVT